MASSSSSRQLGYRQVVGRKRDSLADAGAQAVRADIRDSAPVEIQSFGTGSRKGLHGKVAQDSNITLLQLLGGHGNRPRDLASACESMRHGDLMKPEGLREVAAYTAAISPPYANCKDRRMGFNPPPSIPKPMQPDASRWRAKAHPTRLHPQPLQGLRPSVLLAGSAKPITTSPNCPQRSPHKPIAMQVAARHHPATSH